MSTETKIKPSCENCTFWDGKPTAYLGGCYHPKNYPSRVTFDHTCPLHAARRTATAPAPTQSAAVATP